MRVNNYVPSEEIFKIDSTSDTKNNKSAGSNSVGNFSDMLSKSLNAINDKQVAADNMNAAFVRGDDVNISDVMLAAEEGKLSLQFAVQVRNKLLDAYKELTNMQL